MNKLTNIFILLVMSVTISIATDSTNKSVQSLQEKKDKTMTEKTPKVLGIGGIFFRSKNPKQTKEWYGKNLGLEINEFGCIFESRNSNAPEEVNQLVWSVFKENTDYFEPSQKEFMINYRVQNIEAMVNNLKASGVQVVDEIQTYDYGKFVHIMDDDGNKIELWEPVERELNKSGAETVK